MSNRTRKQDAHRARRQRHENARRDKRESARSHKQTQPAFMRKGGFPNDWKYQRNAIGFEQAVNDWVARQFRQRRAA